MRNRGQRRPYPDRPRMNCGAAQGCTNGRGAIIAVTASVIVGILVMLSLIPAATILFPAIDVRLLTIGVGAALVVGLLAIGLLQLRRGGRPASGAASPAPDRSSWRMPPLEDLPRPDRWRMS